MFVDLQGFEPQITGPKPAVLPLHHRSKWRCVDYSTPSPIIIDSVT